MTRCAGQCAVKIRLVECQAAHEVLRMVCVTNQMCLISKSTVRVWLCCCLLLNLEVSRDIAVCSFVCMLLNGCGCEE